jgi:hypothetical protein
MSEQLAVKVLTSIPEIEVVRDVWAGWQSHPNSDLDFFLAVLRSVPGILRPHVIVVFRNGHPDAILVGRVEQREFEVSVGYKRTLKPEVRALTFIHRGLLGNPRSDNCEVLVREVVKALREGEADVALFNHLRIDTPLYAFVMRSPGFLSRDHFPTLQTHRSMTLPRSVEDFYQGLSKKVRKNQKWQAKRLIQEHAGNVRIRCFREHGELELMIREVEEVARKTYHRALGVGFVASPDMRARLHLQAQDGSLRAYLLYVVDRPWAFWMGTLYHGTFHSNFMGYDPDCARYSPGMFLIMKVIEGFCDPNACDKVKEIDFGLGDAQYKEVLGNAEWREAVVHIFAPSLKGVGLSLLRTPAIVIDKLAKALMERTKLLQRVKKMWRTHAIRKQERETSVGGEPIQAHE